MTLTSYFPCSLDRLFYLTPQGKAKIRARASSLTVLDSQ
jgi:hypothetical protein